MGWAKGRGIKIMIPQKSDICKTMWLYPYEDSAPFRTKCVARRDELRQRANQLANNEQQTHDSRVSAVGKLELMNELQGVWQENPPKNHESIVANFQENRIKYRQFINECAGQEQGLRDQRMQILGAAENTDYVQQTWENSAREMAVEKEIIEGLEK